MDELEITSVVQDAPESRAGRLAGEEPALVRTALDRLPPDQRQALLMAFFEGKTHVEIAEALREPLGTIKARLRRGMLKLRDSLQEFA